MTNNQRGWILLIWIISFGLANAAIDAYEFANEAQRIQFYRVIEQLRCPKCQNQAISGSDAPIAKDIRDRVHQLIEQGKTDQEIIHFMEMRFGEFVNYKPALRPGTWLLWLGPPGLLLLLCAWLWRRRAHSVPEPLSAAEQYRLQQLLAMPSRGMPPSFPTHSQDKTT